MSRSAAPPLVVLVIVLLTGAGCGDDATGSGGGLLDLAYAVEVVSFDPGPGAGYGQELLPEVVLGPPAGLGRTAGSLDVLSLGVGGQIVVGFDPPIVDGPGPDFIVFENPFYLNDDPQQVFAELGRVSGSRDGQTWTAFECDPAAGTAEWPGCAGWRPTLMYDPEEVLPIDPALTGGDPFDLDTVGLAEARFIRIEDLAEAGDAPTAGFDLDAVGAIRR